MSHNLLAQKLTGCICRSEAFRWPWNSRRTTVSSPLVSLWIQELHLRTTIQYTTSFFLTLLRASEVRARLHRREFSGLMRLHLKGHFREENKGKHKENIKVRWSGCRLPFKYLVTSKDDQILKFEGFVRKYLSLQWLSPRFLDDKTALSGR